MPTTSSLLWRRLPGPSLPPVKLSTRSIRRPKSLRWNRRRRPIRSRQPPTGPPPPRVPASTAQTPAPAARSRFATTRAWLHLTAGWPRSSPAQCRTPTPTSVQTFSGRATPSLGIGTAAPTTPASRRPIAAACARSATSCSGPGVRGPSRWTSILAAREDFRLLSPEARHETHLSSAPDGACDRRQPRDCASARRARLQVAGAPSVRFLGRDTGRLADRPEQGRRPQRDREPLRRLRHSRELDAGSGDSWRKPQHLRSWRQPLAPSVDGRVERARFVRWRACQRQHGPDRKLARRTEAGAGRPRPNDLQQARWRLRPSEGRNLDGPWRYVEAVFRLHLQARRIAEIDVENAGGWV